MKKLIPFIALAILSCTPAGTDKNQEFLNMNTEKLKMMETSTSEEVHAKMVSKYGEQKMAWFDSMTDASATQYEHQDSIDHAK